MALSNEDIKKLKEVFATKDDLNDLKIELKSDFSDLYQAIDAYAKKADGYFQEMVMLSKKVDRQEEWIKKIAKEVGVELEY
jgi:uncharacterized coiled-coil DUF342 family protein